MVLASIMLNLATPKSCTVKIRPAVSYRWAALTYVALIFSCWKV